MTSLLNFLCRAIHTGCAFTRQMYEAQPMEAGEDMKRKPHHHVRLDSEFKDCQMRLAFLQNDTTKVAHPFIDLETTVNAEILDWYMDAAKGKTLGFGGVHGKHWFF